MHKRNLILVFFSLLLVSCAGELTSQNALSAISSQKEFSTPFCAPLHLAPEVLTGENRENPQAYIDRRYGALIREGLILAKVGDGNSWRSILKLSLTDKGNAMVDEKRSLDDMYYVQVCRMVADSVLALTPMAGDTIMCRYLISQRELTPFGVYLGFVEGQEHFHERKFVKSTFSWELVEL